jgi:hypothetical protein
MSRGISIHEIIKLEHRIMARIEELAASVAGIKESAERALAEVESLKAASAAASVEDPRIGQAVDALKAVKDQIDAVVPPPAAAVEDHPSA